MRILGGFLRSFSPLFTKTPGGSLTRIPIRTPRALVSIDSPELSLQWPTVDELTDWWPNLKLPFKLRHHERELTWEFIESRVRTYEDGYPELKVEDFEPVYSEFEDSESARSDIETIVLYYNRFMRKSIFGPSRIEAEDMRKMLKRYPGHGQRIRYVHFLFIREFDVWRREKIYAKAREKRRLVEERDAANFKNIGCFENDTGDLQYGYWRNALFLRYWSNTPERYSRHRLRNAALWGQRLVVDCGYDEQMADYETISVARQITKIYHMNRLSRDPFHVMFCGYNPSARWYHHLKDQLSDILARPEYLFNLHREPYHSLLPNDRLIYLSPDSRKVMTEFDPNATYILGALVSKTYKAALSFEKARAENIECLRLPIHQYVKLKPGVKRVLSFEGVFNILLEMKAHGDWERAFRAGIMEHKLIPPEEEEEFRRQELARSSL